MRRFYDYDAERVVTEQELRAVYDAHDARDEMTFGQYIKNCTGKNGALVEIPDGCGLYRVYDDFDDWKDIVTNDAEFFTGCDYYVERLA